MKKWIVFSGYVVFVTLIFLYYLFPTDAMTAYVNSRLSDSLPDYHLSADQIRPSFPPGLKVKSPVIKRRDKVFIKADQVSIRPRYLTLFTQTKSFVINGALNGGRINGTAEIALDTSLVNIDLLVDQVEISGIPAVKEITPHSISGGISGKLVLTNQSPYGSGTAELILSNCIVDFKPAFFGMNQLKMDTISTKAELNDRLLKIDAFEVKGRELNGKASGTVTLRNPLPQSTANISGQVTPTPVLMKSLADILPIAAFAGDSATSSGIPFKISGTIENPNFSLQ